MDLDIRQYKNRYGQNGLEGDVSKSKRSPPVPGVRHSINPSPGTQRYTESADLAPCPEDRRYHAMIKITLEPQTRGQALTHPANHSSPYIALHWATHNIGSCRIEMEIKRCDERLTLRVS